MAGTYVASAKAERPPASQLLPENTVAVLSVPDSKRSGRAIYEHRLGRMTQDPEMKPFVSQLYSSLSELVATVQEQYRIIVAGDRSPSPRRGDGGLGNDGWSASFVVLFDAGDQIANARKLLQRGVDAMVSSGLSKREESIQGRD